MKVSVNSINDFHAVIKYLKEDKHDALDISDWSLSYKNITADDWSNFKKTFCNAKNLKAWVAPKGVLVEQMTMKEMVEALEQSAVGSQLAMLDLTEFDYAHIEFINIVGCLKEFKSLTVLMLTCAQDSPKIRNGDIFDEFIKCEHLKALILKSITLDEKFCARLEVLMQTHPALTDIEINGKQLHIDRAAADGPGKQLLSMLTNMQIAKAVVKIKCDFLPSAPAQILAPIKSEGNADEVKQSEPSSVKKPPPPPVTKNGIPVLPKDGVDLFFNKSHARSASAPTLGQDIHGKKTRPPLPQNPPPPLPPVLRKPS